ncbi:transmembrane anchor protein [Caenimonas sedimenti]|uniref:Transmembrane anchor protein n=2 Tax=Caenimonas sedimenti TaxID=2596921 RepID=A0A562ZI56_9BURK|nr:transmembrane anchor protein [Caenimonas sedimenti]
MYNSEVPPMSELPSASRLLRSTVIALLVAVALLVTVVMPAEYGIDPTGIGRVLGLKSMGEIKMAAQASASTVPPTSPAGASAAPASSVAAATQDRRTDQTSVKLMPGEGVEVKMQMEKGATVKYRWVASGGAVTFDAHGEGSEVKFSVSYKKGQEALKDEGILEAAFKGQHGWYWKNRGKEPVTVGLTTVGQYTSIRRVE